MTDMTAKNRELQADTLELINAELTDRLARQTQADAQIDTKAALLVGYVAAASSFLATRHSQPVLTWLALAAFAAAAGFGIAALAVSARHDAPAPRPFYNEYAQRPKAVALAALAARRVNVFESNLPRHKRKAKRWWISLVALMIGVVLMFAALYVHTGNHDRSGRQGHHAVAAERPG
jgi:hypothetical protein